MKNNFSALLVLFIFPLCAFSQVEKGMGSGLKIRLTPITMLDKTPRIRAGFEYLDNNVVNLTEKEGFVLVEWVPQLHLFEGQDLIIHLTAGFRISYLLWKNKN